MTSEHDAHASPHYALGQLWRALEAAAALPDAQARERAHHKAGRWRAVLDGMASSEIAVGSRTPVADTPAWVTLEVAHGGFATGRYLAETELDEHERELLSTAAHDVPGVTERERINLWSLSDAGQRALLHLVDSRRYAVDVPEHAALPVVAWLVANGRYEAALDTVAELRPLMHRLRFTPRLDEHPPAAAGVVHVATAAEIADSLRAKSTPAQIEAMRESLRLWTPLLDQLVELWCTTVNGELPHLLTSADVPDAVTAGWPCRRFPDDWAQRRAAWLEQYREVSARTMHGSKHRHPRSNMSRLRAALERCPHDSSHLTGREVGWIRRALANTITAHGAPGSERRAALRAMQSAVAAAPTHAQFAALLAGRLDRYPPEGGIPSLDPLAAVTEDGEVAGVPAGTAIPAELLDRTRRGLEAPVEDLIKQKIITSGDVLARVLPQITAHQLSSDVPDPTLACLHARTYAAFRRRRSLLLLNLEHQVRFEELPWVAAAHSTRRPDDSSARASRRALEETVFLALTTWPDRLLPNPLVRELGNLATNADVSLPLVEELAADIFMGTFTDKWRRAASMSSEFLTGSLYARYYDLPDAQYWSRDEPRRRQRVSERWGKRTAEDFTSLCRVRAVEAGHTSGWSVAANGAVLEQSQILTTHNLASLAVGLNLLPRLRTPSGELAVEALRSAMRALGDLPPQDHARLITIKNAAYAWRQGLFFLSLADSADQTAVLTRVLADGDGLGSPASDAIVQGLRHVADGGRFAQDGTASLGGRRFLGWSVGRHWALPTDAPPATSRRST